MSYLSPKYNNRVGVYRTNEIERFGTIPIVYDIESDEWFAFRFVCTAKLSVSPLQTVFVYYSSISNTPTSYYVPSIVIDTTNEPTIGAELGSLSWNSLSDYLGVAKQIAETAGSGNWNFTVGVSPPSNTENDQNDLRVGNTYWVVSKWIGASFNLETTLPIYGSPYLTTCKVLRSGIWVTASTSAYFDFTNIS